MSDERTGDTGAPGAGGKRRGGRRGKLAWRKHVSIADVDSFLEEKRLEERIGAPALLSDAELFAVDTTGDTHLQDAHQLSEPPVLSTKQRRRAALAQPPRCYSVLENTSRVAPPTPAPALAPAPRVVRNARNISLRRLQHAQLETIKYKQRRTLQRTSRRRFDTDVWTQESSARRLAVSPSLESEWLERSVVEHHTAPALRTARPRAPRARPAPPPVPPPHPGQSYNPTYEDHQALLADIAEKEKLLIKKEKHLDRVTTALYKRVKPDQAQSEWVKEMMSGLEGGAESAGSAEGAGVEGDESDGEYRSVNPPVRNKKKADKTRRNKQRARLERHEAQQRRVDKKKIADIYKLRFLEAALSRAESRLERVRSVRAARRSARLAATPPVLNAHKHKPQDDEFLAPHELAPALRQHKHTGNLLRERWESLQRRGALAPSRIFLRKKLRLKRYWKPGHKLTPAAVDKFLSARASRASRPARATAPA